MTRGDHSRRVQLAEAMRALRRSRGLTTTELGTRVGLNQSGISRYENARNVPSRDLVKAWAAATDADTNTIEKLVELADIVAHEVVLWRDAHAHGLANHQKEILDLEASVGVIRVHQQSIIPGLLQTPDYSRQLLTLGFPEHATDEAIAARVQRQAVLYDRSKCCEFVITEDALWAGVCDGDVLRAQWDRLLSLCALPNVDIRILARGARLSVVPSTSFVIFGDQLVMVEELTAETIVREDTVISAYRAAFDALQACALTFERSRLYLASIVRGADIEVSGSASPLMKVARSTA